MESVTQADATNDLWEVTLRHKTNLARPACLPGRLYVLLALISSFFFLLFNYFSEINYLRIYWIDFQDFFSTKWYVFDHHFSIP